VEPTRSPRRGRPGTTCFSPREMERRRHEFGRRRRVLVVSIPQLRCFCGRPRRPGALVRVASDSPPSQTPLAWVPVGSVALLVWLVGLGLPRWCGCMLFSFLKLYFFPFSFAFNFLSLLVFFLQLAFLFHFFLGPCRVKFDVGPCTYVDGIF
jgi:hypothetical protein